MSRLVELWISWSTRQHALYLVVSQGADTHQYDLHGEVALRHEVLQN